MLIILSIIRRISLAIKNMKIRARIIVVPEGTFNPCETINPVIVPTNPIRMDEYIRYLNFFVKRLAMVGGTVSNEMRRIIPTNLMLKTMVTVTKAIRIYENTFSGTFCVRA